MDPHKRQTHAFFLLELDNKLAGRLTAAELPAANAQILNASDDFSKIAAKVPKVYGDIKIKFGTGMSRPFYEWITSSGSWIRKDGAIIVVDAKMTEVSRIEFYRAFVTSFSSPGLDKASRSTASFSADIKPEHLIYKAGNGKTFQAISANELSVSSFGFVITGMENDSEAVTKVEPFGVGHTVKSFSVGTERSPVIEAGHATTSNLAVVLPLASADGMMQWVKQHLDRGDVSRTGVLEYRSTNRKITYFSVEFGDLRVLSTSISDEASKAVRAEMSFSSMKFSPHSGATV